MHGDVVTWPVCWLVLAVSSRVVVVFCRMAENIGGIDSSISVDEIRSMTTSKSSVEDLDNFTNKDAMPQDLSDESYSSEPSHLPPSEVDPSYQVELIIEVPSSMVEDNHALALVQVLPPDTKLSNVPDYLDIYCITITDDSVIDEDPPPSDRLHEDHNYYEEASSLNYDSNQEVLNEENVEDYTGRGTTLCRTLRFLEWTQCVESFGFTEYLNLRIQTFHNWNHTVCQMVRIHGMAPRIWPQSDTHGTRPSSAYGPDMSTAHTQYKHDNEPHNKIARH